MTTETAAVLPPVPTVAVTAPAKADSKPLGRPRLLTDKCLARARTMYESGIAPADIAKQVWCKVSAHSLYYHLRGSSPKGDGKVDMRPRGRKGLTNDQLSRVCELYSEGKNIGEIREALAMDTAKDRKCSVKKVARFSAPTISKGLKSCGVKLRRGRPAKPAPVAAPEASAADSTASTAEDKGAQYGPTCLPRDERVRRWLAGD